MVSYKHSFIYCVPQVKSRALINGKRLIHAGLYQAATIFQKSMVEW
jgi:hypothetical protein